MTKWSVASTPTTATKGSYDKTLSLTAESARNDAKRLQNSAEVKGESEQADPIVHRVALPTKFLPRVILRETTTTAAVTEWYALLLWR